MNNQTRVRLHTGIPPGESSMPTCGPCRKQIPAGDTYASILTEQSALRETRHNVEACLRYTCGPAAVLVAGALVRTFRFALSDWHGGLPGVIVERTEEFDGRGWRAYMIAPESPELMEAAIDRTRTHREEFFRKMAESMAVDMTPRRVFISDAEWTHYVLPN